MDARQQKKVVRDGFEELIQSNDFVVVEGTGHTGKNLPPVPAAGSAFGRLRTGPIWSPMRSPTHCFSRFVRCERCSDGSNFFFLERTRAATLAWQRPINMMILTHLVQYCELEP